MAFSEQNFPSSPRVENVWESLDVMSGIGSLQNVPLSTSTPSSVRRKSRKSWFETNPQNKKFEIAVEKKQKRRSAGRKKSEIEDEVLILTHFTNPPRIGFGRMKPGFKKTRTLIVKNPHDYDQNVKIEKFPFKKNFSTDECEFMVEGNGTYLMTITSTPTDEGSFREMILFLVDGVYRLQAYMFGTVEAPPAKKKPRKGLLGTKVKKPFSVIHTPSLANIAKSYSPKKEKKSSLEKVNKVLSDLENEEPVQKVQRQTREQESGKQRRKSHRRSQTYNKVQELDVSPIKLDTNCNESQKIEENKNKKESFLKIESKKLHSQGPDEVVTYSEKISTDTIIKETQYKVNCDVPLTKEMLQKSPWRHGTNKQLQGSIHKTPEDKLTYESKVTNFVSPNSFLHDSLCSHLGKDESFNDIHPVEKPPFHSTVLPTPERMVLQKTQKDFLSPESFLKELNDSKENFDKSNRQLTEIKNTDDVPSPESLLNDSIPHEVMVKQLATVKTSLFESKTVKTSSPFNRKTTQRNMTSTFRKQNHVEISSRSSSVQIDGRQETFIRQDTLKDFCITPISASPRRETFVKSHAMASHFGVPPLVPSPRRETFVVSKVTKNNNSNSAAFNDRRQELLRSPSSAFRVVSKEADREKNKQSHNKNGEKTGKIVQKNRKLDFSGEGNGTKEHPTIVTQDSPKLHGSENSVTTIDSATVTKCKPKDATKEELKSVGKCLFSPENNITDVKGDNLGTSFGSPQKIPESPGKCDFTRRATLTVTKERPSDALLQATHKSVNACLFDVSTKSDKILDCTRLGSPQRNNHCTVIAEESEINFNENRQKSPTSDVSGHQKRDTSMTLKVNSFPTTPVDLPNSPNPDLSRRSTHVVENPKVLNLSTGQRKRLFPPLEDIDNCCDKGDNNQVQVEEKLDTGNEVREIIAESSDIPTEPANNKLDPEFKQSKDIEDSPGENLIQKTELKENKEDELMNGKIIDVGRNFVSSSNQSELVQTQKDNVNSLEKDKRSGNVGFIVSCDHRSRATTGTKDVASGGQKNPNAPILNKRSQSESRVTRESKRLKTVENTKDEINKNVTQVKGPVTRQRRATVSAAKSGIDSKSNRSKPQVKGVAQSKLILMKKSKSVLPKHPMPFAAKNMYYDERWMEKQERGFVHWLNFVLTPAEDYLNSSKKVKVDASALSLNNDSNNVKLAPTKEILSFREYAAVRRLNQLRRSACKLFQSEPVVRVIQKLEAEIESRRLVIRKDKMVHADLGLKQTILDMLLSYNPLWLRIGLEVIYGELIPIQRNNDVIGLSRFILTRLLGNPDVAKEYAHPTVPHLYRDGYADAIARHMLKKFLLLVYFLDYAKSQRLIHHDPCLFCKDSDFKTTKNMLIEFSRDYLSGEGDVTRHLAYLGYIVSHNQTAMDEFDFAVSNLATDLRDGVRLARVIELLSDDFVLMKKLRAPAISRLQKIHNTEISFKRLAEQGIHLNENGLKVMPKDIVEGHREKTLKLLWALILQYQVEVLLNKQQLQEEINILQKSLKVRNQLADLQRFEQGLQEKRRESAGLDLHLKNAKLGLLLKWCRVVCAFYGIKIENFTVSFGDGRALCYLVHHYHPALVPQKSIRTRTMATYYAEMEQRGHNNLDNSYSDPFSPAVVPVPENPQLYEELLANEKENFKLLYEKVSELGGIPLMLRSVDMSNTIPDEKVVVTYIAYLCARLLDIRHESRAARVIQLAWRKYYLRKSQKLLEIKQKAAVTIQREVRKFLLRQREKRQNLAATTIQSFWRGYQSRKLVQNIRFQRENAIKVEAARVIMRYLQAYTARQRYLKQRKAAICIQAHLRGYIQRQILQREQNAARTIQNFYRSIKCTRKTRDKYMLMKKSATVIQRRVRDWIQERCLRKNRAVTSIQALWRMYCCRKRYMATRSAVIVIQKYTRKMIRQRRYLQLRNAVIRVQIVFRAAILMRQNRDQFLEIKHSCVTIQKKWREHSARKKEMRNSAATIIQSAYRGSVARRNYGRIRKAAVMIQAFVRGMIERKKYIAILSAVVKLQQKIRAYLKMKSARSKYCEMKDAAIKIQSLWRMYRHRSEFDDCRHAAILIQAVYRGYAQRRNFKTIYESCLIVQRHARAMIAGKIDRQKFQEKRRAAVKIQAVYKGWRVRQEVKKSHNAAVVIQTAYRGYIERKYFTRKRTAALVIQRHLRASIMCRKLQREYLISKGAAITIQSYWRGHQVRKMVEKLDKYSLVIQTEFRRFICRQAYLKKKTAAVFVQRTFRNKMKCQKIRRQYLIQKGAAITIQSFLRGCMVRRKMNNLHNSATVIQSVYRGYKTRQLYLKMKWASVVLQSRFRARIEGQKTRKHFLIKKAAAITIQAFFRGHKIRQEMKQSHNAAVKIQSAYRGHRQRQKYCRIKMAALIFHKYYRAKILGQAERKRFLVQKGAAMTIQAHFRGNLVRQEMKKSHNAAVKIQSAYRGYKQKQEYHRIKMAALIVHKYYRAKILGQAERKRFLVQKGAAMTIQAHFRGYLVRQEMKRSHNAAVKIQSVYRGYKQKQEYHRIKMAALIVHKYYRAKILGQAERKRFLVQKGVAITIQAHCRGYLVRQEMKRSHNAAVKIQSVYRGFKQKQEYHRIKMAAIVIQACYRTKLVSQAVRKRFLVQKGAAMTIQSYFRGHLVRQEVKKAHNAAISVQKTFRSYMCRKEYLKRKMVASVIQNRYRAYREAKQSRRKYLIMKGAAITIQAVFRGRKCRRNIQKLHGAALAIQTAYRGHRSRQKYNKQKMAAIVIQGWYRNLRHSRAVRTEFLRKRMAAIKIQSAFRCILLMKNYKKFLLSAVKVQALVRGYLQRKRFLALKMATLACQHRYRANKLRDKVWREYLVAKGAAITIQAWYRGHVVRRTLRQQNRSATLIQASFRKYRQMKMFRLYKHAARTIQTWHRQCHVAKMSRERYLHMRNSALIIQKHYRGYVARKTFKKNIWHIIRTQACARRSLAQIKYKRLRKTAVTLQTRYRAKVKCERQRKLYLKTRRSVLVIQSAFRAWKARKYFECMKSARCIQASFRGYIARKKYLTLKWAVVCLQSHYRTLREMREFTRKKKLIICLQRRWRATLEMKNCRCDYQNKIKSAILIQSSFRGYVARQKYMCIVEMIKNLQARIRGHQQCKKFKVMKAAASTIQRHYRAYAEGKKQRRKYLQVHRATVCLQSAVRGALARKYARKIRACIYIQKTCRMYLAKKSYHHTRSAVIVLQAAIRGMKVRQEYRHYTESVKCLQKNIRTYLFIQRLHKEVTKRREAVTKIQAAYRGHMARKYVQTVKAAIVIQSYTRMCIARRKYRKVYHSVIKCQSSIRGYLARRKLMTLRKRNSAAVCIQRNYREYKRRLQIKIKEKQRKVQIRKFAQNAFVNLAAIKIQRCFRNHRILVLAKQRLHSIILIQRWIRSKLCRLRYLKLRHALCLFQRAARQHLRHRHDAAVRIQVAFRAWLVRQEEIHRTKAATAIQAVWRGRKVRMRCKNKKIEIVRKSLQEANRSATEEKKLGNRTNSALDYLLKYKQLSHILEALIHLDVATRLSPTCCERMVEVSAVHVIYTLIRSCNRSQPHMELIKYSVNILLNLAKYDKTVSAVYEVEESVNVLIELMQIYREKGAIFSRTCMLLGILAINSARRDEIRHNAKYTEKIKSIHLLTVRKHKIDEKRFIRQAKQIAAKSFNSTLPIHTPHKKQHKIRPDWVLRRDKMQEIEDPLQAINFVMDNLHLTPK